MLEERLSKVVASSKQLPLPQPHEEAEDEGTVAECSGQFL